MHQRTRRGARRILWRTQRSPRRSAARRTARGWRLELRAKTAFGALVVSHHDLRAGGPARVREGFRREAGGDRRAQACPRVPPRAPSAPKVVDRRDYRPDLGAAGFSDTLALRRAPAPGAFPEGGVTPDPGMVRAVT